MPTVGLAETAAASRLRVGQQVELAVDPEKPARAFIVDLYCGGPPAAASGRCKLDLGRQAALGAQRRHASAHGAVLGAD